MGWIARGFLILSDGLYSAQINWTLTIRTGGLVCLRLSFYTCDGLIKQNLSIQYMHTTNINVSVGRNLSLD